MHRAAWLPCAWNFAAASHVHRMEDLAGAVFHLLRALGEPLAELVGDILIDLMRDRSSDQSADEGD